MLQATPVVVNSSVIRHAALSMRNASRVPTLLRLVQPGANMLLTSPRRTFVEHSTQSYLDGFYCP